MSNCAEAISRTALQTLISTLVSSTRVTLGVTDLTQAGVFFDDLITNGAYVQVKPSKRTSQDYQGHYDYEIVTRIWYGYAQSTDFDYIIIENLVAQVCAVLATSSNFGFDTGNGNMPNEVEVTGPEEDTEVAAGIPLKYDITSRFKAGIDTPGVGAVAARLVQYSTGLIDFTSTQTVSFAIPTGFRFYRDTVEVVVRELGGAATSTPAVSCGITGANAKYLDTVDASGATALNKRISLTTMLDDVGETTANVSIATAGVVSAGNYKGVLIVRGELVG